MSAANRNAPCPCGSGKKFKRCCGATVSEPAAHAAYSPDDRASAWHQLMQFAMREEFAPDRVIAEQLFWGSWWSSLDDEDLAPLVRSEHALWNYSNFLAVDFGLDAGQTLVELMLERRGPALLAGERRFLEALRDTYVGLYRVAGVEGHRIRLANVWFEEEDAVVENSHLAENLERGELVATRLLTLPSGERAMEDDFYVFPAEREPLIRDLLEADRQVMDETEEMSPQAFLKCTGFRFNAWWMDMMAPAFEAQSQYPFHRAVLTDYLDGGDLARDVPAEFRRLGLYLGRIAATASSFEPGEEVSTSIECRRRPENFPCGGWLMAVIGVDDDLVHWVCPDCGDAGSIESWRGTPFDLSREEPEPDGGVRELAIAPEELRRLHRLSHLSAPALTLLVSGDWVEGREFGLEGTAAEYAALAQCVARELERDELAEATVRSLRTLHDKLGRAASGEPDRVSGARTGELPCVDVPRPHPMPLPAPTEADGGHRLYVRLLDVEPPVWRRIELPSRTPLSVLHHVLIEAMGWDDSHLHLFRQGKRVFAPPGTLERYETEDPRTSLLGRVLPRVGDRLVWEYDFGDGWCHEVRVESIAEERPGAVRLLAGARACPPEDCGGPCGYGQLVEILADPKHPDHAEWRDLYGESFDPAAFDLGRANTRLRGVATATRGE